MSDTIREFSRKVSMRLLSGGVEIGIDQFGGDFLITSYPFSLPAGEAIVTLMLDETEDRFMIYLPDGINPERSSQPVMMRN